MDQDDEVLRDYYWLGLLNRAEEYLAAAATLRKANPSADKLPEPVYFLYFHAIELLLKAGLAANGLSARQIKDQAHNLVALQTKLEKFGINFSDAERELIASIKQERGQTATRYYPDAEAGNWITRPKARHLHQVSTTMFGRLARSAFKATHTSMPAHYAGALERLTEE
ncbi:hypothetical protein [Marivivens marinus]|uniref:hypothetical protein n=1 Tax=Marivivens marinus TaxID=3110173 RepID=UPI003B846E00